MTAPDFSELARGFINRWATGGGGYALTQYETDRLTEKFAAALASVDAQAEARGMAAGLEEAKEEIADHEWLPHLPEDRLKDCLLQIIGKIDDRVRALSASAGGGEVSEQQDETLRCEYCGTPSDRQFCTDDCFFLAECERRAGANREKMLLWIRDRDAGQSYATTSQIVEWLLDILY